MLNEEMTKKAMKKAKNFLKEIENDYEKEELQDVLIEIKETKQEWQTEIKTKNYKKRMLNLILYFFRSYVDNIVEDYLDDGYIDDGKDVFELMLLQEYTLNTIPEEICNELLN